MDPASFCLLLSFQTNITFLQKIDAQKCQSSLRKVLGFEPTPFTTRVCTHYHSTLF